MATQAKPQRGAEASPRGIVPSPKGTVPSTTGRDGSGQGRAGAFKRSRFGLVMVLVGVALVASVGFAVSIGPASLSLSEVWGSIAAHLGMDRLLGLTEPKQLRSAMVWELRLPRVLVAAIVGGGLALCGVIMQSLTRNPLADPYLLGLSSGASLGAVAVIILGVAVALPFAAFGGALLALVASLTLAGALGSLSPTRTVLAGLAVSQFCAAITSFVIFWSATGDSYREILAWLLGSVSGATWGSVAIVAVAFAVVGIPLLASSNVLDAFTFGETSAHSLGLNVNRWRWGLLGAVALLTGALVSVSGSIGFIGLIIPHAVRALVGSGHRRLLPLSVGLGAIFLIWADTLARTIFSPRELPVGVITAAIGAPMFAFVLWKGRRNLS